MSAPGTKSTNISRTALSDEILVNREGSTAVQSFEDLATQLAGSGAVAAALNGAAAGNVGPVSSWAQLAAIAPTRNGQPGYVTTADGGTHTDPVVGGTVANSGTFAGSLSPLGWRRVGAYVDASSKAEQSALTATNAALALKAEQSALDTTNAAVALKAEKSSLDATNAALALKADKSALAVVDGLLAAETAARQDTDAELKGSQDDIEAGNWSRPGEAYRLWTHKIEGDPGALAPISPSLVSITSDGSVILLHGAGKLGPIRAFRIEDGRLYRVRIVIRRIINPADPANHTVRLAMRWLTRGKGALSAAMSVIADLNSFVVADGRTEVTAVISKSAGAGVDIVAPAGVVYGRPYGQTYGDDGTTGFEVVDVVDITDAINFSPDVSGLQSQVNAIISEDLPARMADAESQLGGSKIRDYLTLDTVASAQVPPTVEHIRIMQHDLSTPSSPMVLKRKPVEPSSGIKVQSADGAWWGLDEFVITPPMLGYAENEDFLISKSIYMFADQVLPLYPRNIHGHRLDLEGTLMAVSQFGAVNEKAFNVEDDRMLLLDGSQIPLSSNAYQISLRRPYADRTAYKFKNITIPRLSSYVAPAEITAPVILGIGDSIMRRQLLDVLKFKMSDRGYPTTFVGTFRGMARAAASLTDETGQLGEARDGWKLADVVYRETSNTQPVTNPSAYLALPNSSRAGYNPFIRPATGGDPSGDVRNGYIFDFSYYLTTYGVTAPAIVAIDLGENDKAYTLAEMEAQLPSDLGVVVRSVRAAVPSARIVLYSHGASWSQPDDQWEKQKVIYRTLVKYTDATADSRLHLVSAWAHMSPEGGWVSSSAVLNPDTGVSTGNITDIVHPLRNGAAQQQLAEALAPFIAWCIAPPLRRLSLSGSIKALIRAFVSGATRMFYNQTHGYNVEDGSRLSVVHSNSTGSVAPHDVLARSRGTGPTALAQVNSGDVLGRRSWAGVTPNGELREAAAILSGVDGTPAGDSIPSQLIFAITQAGGTAPVTAMTVRASGNVGIGTGSPAEKLVVVGNASFSGSIAKGSGTFSIDHPLDPENRNLAHGFVEAPRYDLIYRGVAKLDGGRAIVDIDEASNMSPGTFAALTTNALVTSLQNQDGFARTQPGPIEGGRFEIICEDGKSTDTIGWLVIAERNDAFVRSHLDPNTDTYGRFIPEREKPNYEPEETVVQAIDSSVEYVEVVDESRTGTKGRPMHYEAFGQEHEYQLVPAQAV